VRRTLLPSLSAAGSSGVALSLAALAVACARPAPSSPTISTPYADADTDVDTDTDTDTDVDTDTIPDGPRLRIVGWNVEFLGDVGSDEYEATLSVLGRLDADVVMLNEVEPSDEDDLDAMADSLGYDEVLFPSSNPFGSQRNAMLARVPVDTARTWTGADLSGDGAANDVTRYPVSMTVTPDGTDPITIVGSHMKSGLSDTDEFRRAIDAIRTGQAAEASGSTRVVVIGDFNAEVDEGIGDPPTFTTIPAGTPGDYFLGDDLYGQVTGSGIANDVFGNLGNYGLLLVDALQLDGRDATREESGRRLDYIYATQEVHDSYIVSEIYDPKDEEGGLDKAGDVPDRDAATTASDHLPVVIEFSY